MRGTRVRCELAAVKVGITPAHAGNTLRAFVAQIGAWDHPRTCGEHLSREVSGEAVLGSPPHMRGTLFAWKTESITNRITPAHAGNTLIKALDLL